MVNGPEYLKEKAVALGSYIQVVTGKAKTASEGRQKMLDALKSGAALEKFKEMVAAQGGNPEVAGNYELLPKARYAMDITASESGYISGINGQEVGMAVKIIGAGREKKDDILDLSSGVYLEKKAGDYVDAGEKIAVLYGNDKEKMQEALNRIRSAYSYSPEKIEVLPMVHAVITKENL